MIELTTNFFCLTRTQNRAARARGRTVDAGAAAPPAARTVWRAAATRGRRLPHRPRPGPREAAELRPRYNWSLGWSLSASGLTVWPGEGAWGGWDTGGRPWDRDMALGTMPSTAAGMPLGATPTTPGGYL